MRISTFYGRERSEHGTLRRYAAALLACSATVGATELLAINLNDPMSVALGGVQNWYDLDNIYASVGAMAVGTQTYCTVTLINRRTVLTASHCVTSQQGALNAVVAESDIRFSPDAGADVTGGTALSGCCHTRAMCPETVTRPPMTLR